MPRPLRHPLFLLLTTAAAVVFFVAPSSAGAQTPTPTATVTPVVVTATPTPTPIIVVVTATPTPTPVTTPTPTATPLPAVPHDNRWFIQTGYRVDIDTFWNYFNARGGVRTFGYPVSRTFTFLGLTTQFFQRELMQLAPNGQARTMNLLDPDLMPYTNINGSTFPGVDPGIASGAPQPGSPNYGTAIIDYIRANSPETLDGLNTRFYTTFISTVSLNDAFPGGGGDPNLIPALNLELWGSVTSRPQYDPTNRNFVYQRFQRGIMHFDNTKGVTQGILLADWFKSIITGQNLPPDLDQQSKGGKFYKQYNPNNRQWIDRPADLQGTDLTNAFTQQ